MRMPYIVPLTLFVIVLGHEAKAANFDLGIANISFGIDGYADFRAVLPSDQTNWVDGGLGKFRYGSVSHNPALHLGEIFAEGHVQIGGSLLAVASARIEPTQKTFVDFTEAFLRYRPVSLSRWRWSIQAGAFFPPVSLENTDIGWASPWTMTPSAINTWVGRNCASSVVLRASNGAVMRGPFP